MPKEIDNQPLTIKDIREVLIPAMEEVFATKKDLEQFVTKEEFTEFKDQSLTNQDRIIKDLETLIIENKMSNFQKRRERQLLAIIVSA